MEIYVVFVEPQFTGNIGFMARAMMNFNLKNLILVNPPEIDDDAYRFAKHAKGIIENARVMSDFDEVRNFLDYAIATSGVSTSSPKKFKRIAIEPDKLGAKIKKISGKIGIIFGRENYGLYNEEIEKCDILVRIPTSEDYPIMNVTHAAAIIFYEIYRDYTNSESMPLAENFEIELLNKKFSEILDIIDFPEHKRKNVEVMFRRIVGRAILTKWEYHSLMGVFTRLRYNLLHGPKEISEDREQEQ